MCVQDKHPEIENCERQCFPYTTMYVMFAPRQFRTTLYVSIMNVTNQLWLKCYKQDIIVKCVPRMSSPPPPSSPPPLLPPSPQPCCRCCALMRGRGWQLVSSSPPSTPPPPGWSTACQTGPRWPASTSLCSVLPRGAGNGTWGHGSGCGLTVRGHGANRL